MIENETKFTDAFIAEQRELAGKIMLPWKSNILNDRMFIEADPMQIGYICEVPHYVIQNEVSEYMVTSANHYPEALDAIERLRAENDRLRARAERAEQENDRLETALGRIQSWSEAYPLKVFPEPDFKRAHELLTAGGMTLDAIAASNMRHVVEGVGKIARDALKDNEVNA
jgi:hypothetical protein